MDNRKERVRLKLMCFVPKLMLCFERYQQYQRTYIPAISDLYVHQSREIRYDPTGHAMCMFREPPAHYSRQLSRRNLDEQGVPRFLYRGELYYQPSGVAQYGLSEYGYWLSDNNEVHLERSLASAEWLLKNQDPESGLWPFNFPYPHRRAGVQFEAPWHSAMAQGLGISLLTRMFYKTERKCYLDAALKATKMLSVPVAQGGLMSDLLGHPVYEEYPTPLPSITLNGFCFCLIGLYDLSRCTDDGAVTKLWEEGLRTLDFMVPFFDNDLVSSYDLTHILAERKEKMQALRYHIIHIHQLQVFQSIAPRDVFARYISKWSLTCGVRQKEQ